MSLLKAIKAQLGLSNTPANNFTITAEADNGTLKLARGNAGSTTQDILTVDASGLVGFPVSKAIETPVKDALNATGSAPVYACRAWVNFNGTGTVAIRASGNVSSITDNGTGDYTVNFTTAMPDANYAFTVGFNNDNNAYPRVFGTYSNTPTANGIRLRMAYTLSFGTQVFEDLDRFCVAIHR